MTERILVTAALPYANGSIHLGHLVEYCQADIYVRALKRLHRAGLGPDALYVCANDAHGTPIELNARKLGLSPEELVARFHAEHRRDFARFDVAFDHFGITHSDTNRQITEQAYKALREKNLLVDRDLDGNWCETDQRFLPDRFIKGTCPRCGAADQYGDVCEACGATYAPTDLKEPHCVLCGKAPVTKTSKHVFFQLGADSQTHFLRQWIDSGSLQPDVANYVRTWIEGGLKDWCISRDGPYFGFAIPDRPGKYFYVWLDAPLGYVASSVEWGRKHGVGVDELWRSPSKTRIEHFIGKDIVYFHTLFWPAVLNAVGYTLPSKVHVHGMLTIGGEKMSKSRGTFINAATFAEHVDPQALRFYYAGKYGAASDDLDLSLDDFVTRINGELVNKHVNLFSRVSQFLAQKLEGRLGELAFAPEAAQAEPDESTAPLGLARRVTASCRRIEELYREREFGLVVRELGVVADIGNEFMQAQKPWDELKKDPETARATCTFVANVCHALAMYLWPIVPRLAEAGAKVIGSSIDRMDARLLFRERNRAIGATERLFERIERSALDAVVEATKSVLGKAAEPPAKTSAPSTAPSATKALIPYEQFQTLDLRVGVIVKAERVPKSNKLLRLEVDLGEAAPRQIVAGIAQAYPPERLTPGTRVVVVANLQPAKLMGVESQGMVLAAGESPELSLLSVEKSLPAGTTVK